MKHFISIIFLLVVVIAPGYVAAQPARLTKEQFGDKGNQLLNAGKQKEALELTEAYPEFADEAETLYIKSIAYTELRDYKNADIYFQRQFNLMTGAADLARQDALEILNKKDLAKMDNDLALLMLGTSLASYGSADLVNSLRGVAFDRNGMPAAVRNPRNIPGYEEMLVSYREVSIQTGLLQLKANELKEALKNTNKAVQLGPKDPAAYAARAQVYKKMKKAALARADDVKARKLSGK